MATKAQHSSAYQGVPKLLRSIREEAGFTQRSLAETLGRHQQWVHNSEVANRRVDVAEFCEWCTACGVDPAAAVRRFVKTAGRQR